MLHNEAELYEKLWFKSSDFFAKNSFDLNRDLNQLFKSPWFKSANPDDDDDGDDVIIDSLNDTDWLTNLVSFISFITRNVTRRRQRRWCPPTFCLHFLYILCQPHTTSQWDNPALFFNWVLPRSCSHKAHQWRHWYKRADSFVSFQIR